MGKRIKETFEQTADKATRDSIANHAADIRFYGMGDAFVCDIVAELCKTSAYVDVQVVA